ncbi:TetR/AcrR family transcriptional regulator [Orrella marina]|uniref:TetR family transcriptional regulator n=1 Tax=Orrella marina TaxID=2163011 RepID=A0A2R4XGF4_9BURK|nr:TetR/AcrR family transcriptional regulator [Orrella marina]AWB32865.1 TetR family transcriptional regulator [Orrella marina]
MPTPAARKKASFKAQQLKFREDAILDVVNRLLAQKGFDLMTMDEVAAEVGIAKASLYKHFASKEALAAASMTRFLDDSLEVANSLSEHLSAIEKLKAVVRWAVRIHLSGTMPSLPSTRSSIQQTLIEHQPYVERLTRLTEVLGEWIEQAQAKGDLSASLPAEVILYTIYSRSCDPVADFLKAGGAFSDDDIVELLIHTCFEGMTKPPRVPNRE